MRLVLLLVALGIASPAAASDHIALSFRVLQSAPEHARIDQVCCDAGMPFASEAQFQVRTRGDNKPIWLRFDVDGLGDVLQLTPILDDVTAYYRLAVGAPWQAVRSGDQIDTELKSLASPFIALQLPATDIAREVYVRIVQSTAISVEAASWSMPAFDAMQVDDRTVRAFLLGIIIAMVVYNLGVSIVVRDLAFALNAGSVLSLTIVAFYLSGYGGAYLWGAFTGWSNSIFLVAVAAATVIGAAFIWQFIRAEGEALVHGLPLFIPPAFAILLLTSALVLPFSWVQSGLLICAAALFALALGICIRRAVAGEPKARILLFPLVFALIPGLALVAMEQMAGLHLLPIGNGGLEVTLCLEAALFSLALASRIRITEQANRVAAEDILRLQAQSASRALVAQDNERRRLAQELHDGVGQQFLLVVGGLKRLAAAPRDVGADSELRDLAGTANAALGDLRRVSHDMHPAGLEHLGLVGTIGGLLAQVEAATQIDTSLVAEIDDARLSRQAQLHLYRIIQESVANTVRHAEATACKVSINQRDQEIVLEVEDDGQGLNEDSRPGGLGFVSIDERVRTLGGSWARSASQMGGLRLAAVFPLAAMEADNE